MAPEHERPSWQVDECPAWCVTLHAEPDLLDDRFHDSAPHYLTAVLGDRTGGDDLLVITSRRCGTTDDWTYVGPPERVRDGLLLSPETAHRLAETLTRHLGDL